MFRIVKVKNLNYSKINFHMLSHDGSTIYPSCYIYPNNIHGEYFYSVYEDEEQQNQLGVIPNKYKHFFEEAIADNAEHLLKFIFVDKKKSTPFTQLEKTCAEEMERIAETMDPEIGHISADHLLIDYLCKTGSVDMALTFARMEKWYA